MKDKEKEGGNEAEMVESGDLQAKVQAENERLKSENKKLQSENKELKEGIQNIKESADRVPSRQPQIGLPSELRNLINGISVKAGSSRVMSPGVCSGTAV